ncbi:MAG: hypothetical protein WKF89_02335 [Chitinophagaceae bacterium]
MQNNQGKQHDTQNEGKTGKASQEKAGDVREGQEDSSILHDKVDPDKELTGTIDKDISSTSQEEFIDNDKNNLKEGDL